jgi:hypothetical protein
MAEYSGTQDIVFTKEWQVTVGGLRLVVGSIGTQYSEAYLYAAAFTQRDLQKDRCGYGTTEKEAIADFFRYLRPGETRLAGLDF